MFSYFFFPTVFRDVVKNVLPLAFVLFSAGCGLGDDTGSELGAGDGRGVGTPQTVVDDTGRAHGLDQPPSRVISFVPSMTELIVALGGADLLVARTQYDADPRLAELPSFRNALTPNLEAVAGLGPDLVVAWADEGDRTVSGRLGELGIPVYTSESQNVEDIRRHAINFGRILHRAAAADSLLTHIDEEIVRLQDRLAGVDTASAFYVVWNDPPQTIGRDTFLSQVLQWAGARNIFGDVTANWPTVSMEEVVRRDPDALILVGRHDGSPGETEWIYRTPGWRSLRAVLEGRVLVVDAALFNRPGPRIHKAAAQLGRLLYPERFPEEREPGS